MGGGCYGHQAVELLSSVRYSANDETLSIDLTDREKPLGEVSHVFHPRTKNASADAGELEG